MLTLTLALLLVAAASPAAAIDRPPLCQALHDLADAARTSRQPQRIAAPLGGPACRPGADTPVQRAFCAAAADAVGADGADMLPWRLYDCVDDLSSGTQRRWADGDVGPKHKKRLARLTASLGHGVRMDVGLAAGGYDLVVWSPN